MALTTSDTIFDLLFALKDKQISLAQFRAQVKDLGISDEDTDLYLDGDAADMDEDQLGEF